MTAFRHGAMDVSKTPIKGDGVTGDLLRQGSGGKVVASPATGWRDYADTQYTSGSPFALSANVDTLLPNNGLGGVSSYKPRDIPEFYSDGKIVGRNGDAMVWTLNLVCTPTNAGTTYIEFWVDIGGAVGELYRRIVSFPKGNGVERPITLSTAVYTLDTWQANGGAVYVRANGTANLYNIRHIFYPLHRAG